MDKKYYYLDDNEDAQGAFSSAQIFGFHNMGKIDDNTRIAEEGSDEWIAYVDSLLALEHRDSRVRQSQVAASRRLPTPVKKKPIETDVSLSVGLLDITMYIYLIISLIGIVYGATEKNYIIIASGVITLPTALVFKALSDALKALREIGER